jgi:hypothetical protein
MSGYQNPQFPYTGSHLESEKDTPTTTENGTSTNTTENGPFGPVAGSVYYPAGVSYFPRYNNHTPHHTTTLAQQLAAQTQQCYSNMAAPTMFDYLQYSTQPFQRLSPQQTSCIAAAVAAVTNGQTGTGTNCALTS